MSHISNTPLKAVIFAGALGLLAPLTACTQNTALADPAAAQTDFQVSYVDAKGARDILASNPQAVILDIRTAKEVSEGHIDGAVFADFYAADFDAQLTKLDRRVPYIVHCRSGGRSTKALTTLERLGFTNITHMDGGIRGWNSADLPLKTP